MNVRKKKDTKPVSTKLYIEKLIEKYHKVKTHVVKETGISERYAWRLLKGERQMSRDHAISFGLSIGANVDEINCIIRLANHIELRDHVKRDRVIIYCINNGMNTDETNKYLHAKGLPELINKRK